MIDHVGISCADYPRSQAFYDSVLGVLGFTRQLDFGEAIGYGRDGNPDVVAQFLQTNQGRRHGRHEGRSVGAGDDVHGRTLHPMVDAAASAL